MSAQERVEWGVVTRHWTHDVIGHYRDEQTARAEAERSSARSLSLRVIVVRRTVTVGEWETAE